ncbi:WhiB family transcriptional regulator [Streptomyces sp. NPDC085946]|uniref:WhiB family transcriptional regulator n=1 Tax=Streptomyces sp. NPDC085946 TaxID=3365744 RepID=UPI0037D58E5E
MASRPAPSRRDVRLPDDRGWLLEAACIGEDPELFFPLDERENDPQVARARAVCRRCRVLLDCRAWALDQGEDAGIWGATTAAQRRAIRRALFDGPARRWSDRPGREERTAS